MSKLPSRPVRSEGAVARHVPAKIDLSYRPRTYFWPHGLKPHPLSSIKGAERRALIGRVLAEDPDSYVPPVLLQSALPDPLRIFLGAQHPSAMGGEYLPDMEAEEVEIARITIGKSLQRSHGSLRCRAGPSSTRKSGNQRHGATSSRTLRAGVRDRTG